MVVGLHYRNFWARDDITNWNSFISSFVSSSLSDRISRCSFACFRPTDRSAKDVDAITSRLRRVDTLNRLPNSVLQQLAFVGYYEDLERGVMRKSEMENRIYYAGDITETPSSRNLWTARPRVRNRHFHVKYDSISAVEQCPLLIQSIL